MAQYENKGDRLNILLADELPEDMTGTQDTQHICGKCALYSFAKLESICRKTGKEVAYFANRECFTTDKDMDMEENNNAQPVAETGTQVCKECGRTLPLEEFQRRRYGKRDKVCKACRAEKIRVSMATGKEKKVKVDIPEKKPAEWSDEDKDMLNSCISSIEEAKENRYAYKETDGDTSYDHEIAWLKSLGPRQIQNVSDMITPNKKFFQWIYNRLVYVHKENPNVDYMRSFKERIEELSFDEPHWKPSEEQKEALEYVIRDYREDGCNATANYLQEILDHLKNM